MGRFQSEPLAAAHLAVLSIAATLLIPIPLAAQAQPGTPARSANPAILQIRVLEGESMVYATGSRATRGVVVLISDETGRAVENATVSFRLPESGPSGTFADGGRTDIALTAADGRAEVWGMRWNNTAGPLDLRITAAKGDARAGTAVPLMLMEDIGTDAQGSPGSTRSNARRGTGSKFGGKKLWMTVAIVGAVAAVAGISGGSATQTTAPPAINAPQIGSPEIHIGVPRQ